MSEWRADFELLQAFARQGDQPAFATLTRRHLDLVYATALRKVTDGGGAEEICQNVFGALARKAWQFAPDDSLPSWLHRTTLLESKSWLRGELRRRRREETAAQLGTTMNTPEDQPTFRALVPLLDEALLSLREKDRTALLLRFYESHSLREVGAAVGASEDAARMRVQSALEKLAEFFKRHGFKTASVATATAALETSAATASAAVAEAVVSAALQVAPPALAGLSLLLARLTSLTKVQRAAVGVALVAALLFWLWRDQQALAQRPQPPSIATQLAARNTRNLPTSEGIMKTTTLTQYSLPLLLSAGLAASNALGPNRLQAQSVFEPYTFTNFAGTLGGPGYSDGTGSGAQFRYPQSVAVDSSGNVYVADTGNSTIRKITPTGVVTTLAGLAGSRGSDDGTGSAARFYYPSGVAVDSSGIVYVADFNKSTIRKITQGGVVTTLAGLAGSVGSADGTGSAARFLYPQGVSVDPPGNVYVADTWNHTIRKITPGGVVTTLAGLAGFSGSSDGTNAAARFDRPSAVAVDPAGNVFVTDEMNHTIRKITPAGAVTTLAGLAGSVGSEDGTGSTARFYYPHGIAVDSEGNVYVADNTNHTIRKITPGGVVTTLAGLAGFNGNDDGSGSAARFYYPSGVAVDSSGIVYVADEYNHTIRRGWVPLRMSIGPDGTGGFFLRVKGAGNLRYQLQRTQTLNGSWTTNAVQTAPASGLLEFHDLLPPPGRAFYRAFQE